MPNLVNRIDRVLKTKEDMQNFVLIAFILFILFVKCYMTFADPKVTNDPINQRNADLAKTEINAKS